MLRSPVGGPGEEEEEEEEEEERGGLMVACWRLCQVCQSSASP